MRRAFAAVAAALVTAALLAAAAAAGHTAETLTATVNGGTTTLVATNSGGQPLGTNIDTYCNDGTGVQFSDRQPITWVRQGGTSTATATVATPTGATCSSYVTSPTSNPDISYVYAGVTYTT